MRKLDLQKQTKDLYQPSAKQPVLVDVPPMQFAMIDGAIEPGQSPSTSPSFQDAVQALYGIAYGLKFFLKKRPDDPVDYSVMPLEALWWIEAGTFDIRKPDNWHWRAMIMQPDVVDEALFQTVLADLRKKKPSPGVEKLRLGAFHEGLCLQVMHLGPYADEPATLDRMHAFAQQSGYTLRGQHHEIYLGDPRRADPANLKTVLRHPVEKP